ncbi:MAG: hypothetical protein FE041_02825 [Thermoplasmata archaeon]|nr:MAG: hypothetical protein FE041_02825 [Thermoplasmata archaeon]
MNNEREEMEEFFKLIVEFRDRLKDYLDSEEVRQLFSEKCYKEVEDGIIKLRKKIMDENKITQKVLLTGYLDTLINRCLLVKILGMLYNMQGT